MALAGCGTVGAALVSLVRQHQGLVERRHGVRFELVRVLVRNLDKVRGVSLPRHLLATHADEFLLTEADVLVEAIGGLDPAERLVRGALAQGRHVVTASKELIAAQGPALQRLADGVLKFLSGAVRGEQQRVRAWVRPVIVPANHEFARVRDEENAVHIDSESLGVLRLQGRGAGGSATASAVLEDMLAAVR